MIMNESAPSNSSNASLRFKRAAFPNNSIILTLLVLNCFCAILIDTD